jgi:hypothetical protein
MERSGPMARYLVDENSFGHCLIHALDGEHDIQITNEEGHVLGSKTCTRSGPEYYLHKHKETSQTSTGVKVQFETFKLNILEYKDKTGDIYCQTQKRDRT